MDASVTPSWAIDSETGTLRDVLMCRPVGYEWQPANSVARRTIASGAELDRQRLDEEFRELTDALTGADVEIHYLRAERHLPYQVYTRDSSQVTPWGPVLTQMFRPARRGEYAAVLDFYGGSDAFWRLVDAGTIEGGDIHLIRPGLAAIGWSGERTTEAGAQQFAGWLRDEGWEVRLEPFDEHFLHLDLLYSSLADGLALACRDVLEDGFLDWLAAHGIRTIDVSYKEAVHHMAGNVLALGRDRIVSPRHNADLNARLRAEGFTVLDPDLRLFAMGGGSVHCMTMPLRRDTP